jgi:hypothetical protein
MPTDRLDALPAQAVAAHASDGQGGLEKHPNAESPAQLARRTPWPPHVRLHWTQAPEQEDQRWIGPVP